MTEYRGHKPFPSAVDDASSAKLCVKSPQTESPAYQLAYLDEEFLLKDELRPVRLQLELLKPELGQQAAGVESTVVVFGSARIAEPQVARIRYDKAQANVAKEPENSVFKADSRPPRGPWTMLVIMTKLGVLPCCYRGISRTMTAAN